LCGYGFATTRALSTYERRQQQQREAAKPVLFIDATYYTYNHLHKFGVVIRTQGLPGKENIDRLVITCPMPGLITNVEPRANIINAEPCTTSIESFYAVEGKALRHVAKIICKDVLPGAMNGVVITYEPMTEPQELQFDDVMRADFFWRYEGKLQQEAIPIAPRKTD
jgi:hypothetical protein